LEFGEVANLQGSRRRRKAVRDDSTTGLTRDQRDALKRRRTGAAEATFGKAVTTATPRTDDESKCLLLMAFSSLRVSDLPKRILTRTQSNDSMTVNRAVLARKIERGAMSLKDEIAALQRVAIEEALRRTGGNAAQAARLLGEVGRGVARDPGGTLRAMMRRLGQRNTNP
jgi:transcriptional regulator with GAF, ATPase, and Fis domain